MKVIPKFLYFIVLLNLIASNKLAQAQSFSYPSNFINKNSLKSKIAKDIVSNINDGVLLKKKITNFVDNPMNKFSCKSRVWGFWEANRDMQQDLAVMPSLGFSDKQIEETRINSINIGWRLINLIDEDCQ